MLVDVQKAIASRPSGTRLLLLSDFDGTLADFHPDPAAPRPSPTMAALMARIAARPDVSFGIVTGRRVSDLRSRTELPDSVYLAGLHGLEIERGMRRWQHPDLDAAREAVRELYARLEALRERTPGLMLEDKDVSVAVHVRGVRPELRDEALAQADACGAPWVESGRLRRLSGKMVLEFLPSIDVHKGDAVRWIAADVEAEHGQPAWVVFIGDDITDEDAFRAITNGIGVLVGSRESAATHRIANTREVEALLAWLAGEGAGEA